MVSERAQATVCLKRRESQAGTTYSKGFHNTDSEIKVTQEAIGRGKTWYN